MLQYYIYPLIAFGIIAILFIPFKFVVMRFASKEYQRKNIAKQKEALIDIVDKLPFLDRMRITNLLNARTKTAKKVSTGLIDTAAEMREMLKDLK